MRKYISIAYHLHEPLVRGYLPVIIGTLEKMTPEMRTNSLAFETLSRAFLLVRANSRNVFSGDAGDTSLVVKTVAMEESFGGWQGGRNWL